MYCKFSAKSESSLYFLVWLLIGLSIYAGYSYRAKRLEEQKGENTILSEPEDIVL